MSNWYYSDTNNERQGPISAIEINQLLQTNVINMQTLVWSQGMLQWEALSEVFAVVQVAIKHEQKTNNTSPHTDKIQSNSTLPHTNANSTIQLDKTKIPNDSLVSNNIFDSDLHSRSSSKQIFSEENNNTQSSLYAAPQSQTYHNTDSIYLNNHIVYAGFEKRLAAYIIDGFVLGIIGMIVGFISVMLITLLISFMGNSRNMGGMLLSLNIISYLINIIISLAYYIILHSSSKKATLGKMAVGIKVVKSNGEQLTLLQSFLRYLALFLSGLPLCFGFIMAGFTEKKQALHDIVCDTLVVDEWAFTNNPERQNPKRNIVAIIVNLLFILSTVSIVAIILILIAMGR